MVYLRAGAYHLDTPLCFGPEDSGTPEGPVVWQAYHNEAVGFSGSRVLTSFETVSEGLVQCPWEGPEPVDALYFDGERQIPARWPNRTQDVFPGGEWAFTGANTTGDDPQSFVFNNPRPKTWASWEGVQISIWPNYNWWQTIVPVAAYDAETGMVSLAEALPYTIQPGRRFFFQHVREELDAPGEWYYDAAEKKILFRPTAPLEGMHACVPVLENAIVFENARHINFIGFHIRATRGDAVVLNNAQECLFAKNTIENTGGFGVVVRGGKKVRVVGNDICHTGAGGIILSGGDRPSLTPARHQAVNNHIHHFGEILQTYQTAVNVSGVGNLVSHNLIHDAPHIGILLGGNDHLIEFNEIHHVCMEGSDNGGFYMGRDWTQRGNVIQYNKFHDIYGFGVVKREADGQTVYQYERPHQAWGIYLDDCSSGTKIHGNIFYRVPLCGVMIGGGRDNAVYNNVFVDCIPALHIDDRWDSYCWDVMQERLEAMNYTTAALQRTLSGVARNGRRSEASGEQPLRA